MTLRMKTEVKFDLHLDRNTLALPLSLYYDRFERESDCGHYKWLRLQLTFLVLTFCFTVTRKEVIEGDVKKGIEEVVGKYYTEKYPNPYTIAHNYELNLGLVKQVLEELGLRVRGISILNNLLREVEKNE